jgi:membrane protein
MRGMWGLGGLPIRELLKRTVRESWDDDVFATAAQLAFYHFLAIFPVLLLLLIPLAWLSSTGAEMRTMLSGSFRLFLPEQAAALVAGAIHDLSASARGGSALLAGAAVSGLWAGINASWAMIVGLNTAYETKEDRGWRQIAGAAIGLGAASVALVFAALLTTDFIRRRFGPDAGIGVPGLLVEWAAIAAVLLISFALFYRFGPNLRRQQWQWSTPGAVVGVVLWVAITLAIRAYFDRFASYQHIYGRLAATAMLMIWLYATSATVLIGAELNSEIEKAEERAGGSGPQAERVQENKSSP